MATSIAIVVATFKNPLGLQRLLANMQDSGLPDVPLYVFEDPSPDANRRYVTKAYKDVLRGLGIPLYTAPNWGCMQGIIDFALRTTNEDWVVYVPDDVHFPVGGLCNEVDGIRAYGKWFVGGIQAPYWNLEDLLRMGVPMENPPRNPHWEGPPRAYVNLNGAGFSISRELYRRMRGWPRCTWRLDEWAGFQAWVNGMVCITLPGPPRVHFGGGSLPVQPKGLAFHTEAAWIAACGMTPAQSSDLCRQRMQALPGETWEDIESFYG